MKKLITTRLVLGCPVSSSAMASDIIGDATYRGAILAVAPGYFQDIGIRPDDTICNGRPEVLLQSSNARYTELLSLFITAQSTHAAIAIARLANNPITGDDFCTVSVAAWRISVLALTDIVRTSRCAD